MINNEFYKELGEKWYTSSGEAVALLRHEKKVTNPWCVDKINKFHGAQKDLQILDIGCGGGFLTLALAEKGWHCTGLDVSEDILNVGRVRDLEKKINWVNGTAENLPLPDSHFDVVCMMDVLEHIFEPELALKEAVRVLKPGGTILFHTFNRTILAWLFAAKGLDWFIRDSQTHVHDWNLFIRPRRLKGWLRAMGVEVLSLEGLHPKIWSRAFFRLLLTRRVPDDFSFRIGGGLSVGYLGVARFGRGL